MRTETAQRKVEAEDAWTLAGWRADLLRRMRTDARLIQPLLWRGDDPEQIAAALNGLGLQTAGEEPWSAESVREVAEGMAALHAAACAYATRHYPSEAPAPPPRKGPPPLSA